MIKNILIYIGGAFCILLLSGCEWTTGGSVNNWHSLNSSVDFSGTYKAPDGGVLVRKFGSGANSTNTTYTTNNVTGELLGAGNGSSTAFSGVLAHPALIRGSLTIVVGGYRFNDTSGSSAGTVALTVTPADGSAGTINYNTGAWTLSFPSPIANGTQILAAYSYLDATTVINNNQGNHGNPIYSMVLYQQGNAVQIVDSCNSRYEGTLGSATSNATQIAVQLYATGYSQGYNVEIAGTMQSIGGSRTMKATFIEDGGYDADINGAAQ